MKPRLAMLGALALCVLLAGCATQLDTAAAGVPGFWMGLVHGFIAPFDLVAHLFDYHIRMYAVPNSGGWYDLGFLIGVSSLCGGGVGAAR